MAKIYIDPTPAKSVLTKEESLAQKLNTLSIDLDSIRRNLRYKIAAQEKISAHLTEVVSQVSKEKTAVNALKDGFVEIIAQYDKAERLNIGRLAAIAAVHTEASNHRPSGQEMLDVSQKEKDKFIQEFENENPKLAKIFHKFLARGKNNSLTEDDIRNIKYLTYKADEPFRSIYLNSLSKYSIGNGDMDEGAYYKPLFHTVNYTYDQSNVDSFGNDPRGPYTVFFHESGHAIDDLSDVSKWWGSDTEKFTAHSGSMGRDITLSEAIEYDVYYNTSNPHSMTSIANEIKAAGVPGTGSKGNIENVIAAFQSGDTNRLSGEDLVLYNAVRNQHIRTTGGSAQYESVSDVYGGMSNNALRTGYGHDSGYWTNKTNAAKELWAEYFSYNMSGSMENLEHLLGYFPEAAKVMEQYAHTLGG